MAVKKSTRSSQSCNYGDDCPPGQWCNNGTCVPQAKKPGAFSTPSAKIAAGILGAGMTAIGTRVAKNIKENKPIRQAKRAAKKNSDLIAKKGGEKKTTLVSSPAIMMKKGGSTDKKWIQKAINPAHKGYCTPMTKSTCTPKRKALAITLKKMAKNR
jgi:hypothetical protein